MNKDQRKAIVDNRKKRDLRNYRRPSQLRNYLSKGREQLIPTPPDKLVSIMDRMQAADTWGFVDLEVTLDIRRAMQKFTVAERNLLCDYLVKGLPLELAIRRSRKRLSLSSWRTWLNTVALPRLRANLAQYWAGDHIELRGSYWRGIV